MKTKILIILIAFSVSNIFAQTDSLTLQKSILRLENQLVKQEKKLNEFYKELDKEYRIYKIIKADFNDKHNYQEKTIDSLQQVINSNSANVKKTANELGVKIEDTHKFTNQSITDLNKTVSQNTLYWIIAILVVALFVLLVFVLLRKQIFKQKTDLDSNLQDTRKVLEEEGIKLDNKLIEVLDTQLKIINNNSSGSEKEADHTLALKVADEIIRIQKNLTRMDEKTKGLKQLTASVKRIQDNFASNGYEIVEMLGKAFNDGMKVSANFVPDEDLETGQQIITRIIKPQVNYKEVMIQSAQIEVSQG
jgi:type VII secretion protein EssA